MPRDNWPQLAHKGIPPACSPLYCLLLYCTLYNSVHGLKLTLRSSLLFPFKWEIRLLFQHNSHQNREPIMLKIMLA